MNLSLDAALSRITRQGRPVAINPDLAVVLEEPDGVDTRDLLVHVLAATIEEPSWPALLVEMPATAFHRMRCWLPLPRLGMVTRAIH